MRVGKTLKIKDLFLTFMKIGLFTFGGGYAMIPIIEDICVDKRRWISHDEMMEITVIAEATPGPIAINCATFVGYKQAGAAGAGAATLGVILPSFCIIFVISMCLEHFLEITWVANAFRGIKIAVGILILNAAVNMIKKMPKKPMPVLTMAVSCFTMILSDLFSWRVSTIVLMVAAAGFSLSVYGVKQLEKRGR